MREEGQKAAILYLQKKDDARSIKFKRKDEAFDLLTKRTFSFLCLAFLLIVAFSAKAEVKEISCLGTSLGSGYVGLLKDHKVHDFTARRQNVTVAARYIEEVIATRSEYVFIEYGVNDAAKGSRQDKYAELTEKLIIDLKKGLPGVKIFMLLTNPTHGKYENRNAYIVKINSRYKELANQYNLGVIDLHSEWLKLDREALIEDGIHPSKEGWDAVKHIIFKAIGV